MLLLLTTHLILAVPILGAAAAVRAASSSVTLDPYVISLLGGVLIPLLTAVVTKYQASTGVKAIVALALSAVVGVASNVVTAGVLDWRAALLQVATAFVASYVSLKHLWQPIGDTPDVPGSHLWPNFGLGGKTVAATSTLEGLGVMTLGSSTTADGGLTLPPSG